MENKLSFSERFKSSIRFFASLFASREFAVLYCIIGTVAEVAHMYYLTYSISALTGWFKVAQAIMLSGFISSSLLYFVLISDDRETTSDDEKIRIRAKKDSKRINLAINIFTFINIAINFYYYCRHLIIDSTEWQMFDFIFAVLVSCLLPITIKLYANGIHVKDWVVSDETKTSDSNDNSCIEIDTTKIVEEIKSELTLHLEEYTVNKINEIQLPNKEQIKIAFEEHSRLFLNQFDNKLKILSNKIINKKHTDENETTNHSDVSLDAGVNNHNNTGDSVSDSNTDTKHMVADTVEPAIIESEPEASEIRNNVEPEIEPATEQPAKVGFSVDEYLEKLNQ